MHNAFLLVSQTALTVALTSNSSANAAAVLLCIVLGTLGSLWYQWATLAQTAYVMAWKSVVERRRKATTKQQRTALQNRAHQFYVWRHLLRPDWFWWGCLGVLILAFTATAWSASSTASRWNANLYETARCYWRDTDQSSLANNNNINNDDDDNNQSASTLCACFDYAYSLKAMNNPHKFRDSCREAMVDACASTSRAGSTGMGNETYSAMCAKCDSDAFATFDADQCDTIMITWLHNGTCGVPESTPDLETCTTAPFSHQGAFGLFASLVYLLVAALIAVLVLLRIACPLPPAPPPPATAVAAARLAAMKGISPAAAAAMAGILVPEPPAKRQPLDNLLLEKECLLYMCTSFPVLFVFACAAAPFTADATRAMNNAMGDAASLPLILLFVANLTAWASSTGLTVLAAAKWSLQGIRAGDFNLDAELLGQIDGCMAWAETTCPAWLYHLLCDLCCCCTCACCRPSSRCRTSSHLTASSAGAASTDTSGGTETRRGSGNTSEAGSPGAGTQLSHGRTECAGTSDAAARSSSMSGPTATSDQSIDGIPIQLHHSIALEEQELEFALSDDKACALYTAHAARELNLENFKLVKAVRVLHSRLLDKDQGPAYDEHNAPGQSNYKHSPIQEPCSVSESHGSVSTVARTHAGTVASAGSTPRLAQSLPSSLSSSSPSLKRGKLCRSVVRKQAAANRAACKPTAATASSMPRLSRRDSLDRKGEPVHEAPVAVHLQFIADCFIAESSPFEVLVAPEMRGRILWEIDRVLVHETERMQRIQEMSGSYQQSVVSTGREAMEAGDDEEINTPGTPASPTAHKYESLASAFTVGRNINAPTDEAWKERYETLSGIFVRRRKAQKAFALILGVEKEVYRVIVSDSWPRFRTAQEYKPFSALYREWTEFSRCVDERLQFDDVVPEPEQQTLAFLLASMLTCSAAAGPQDDASASPMKQAASGRGLVPVGAKAGGAMESSFHEGGDHMELSIPPSPVADSDMSEKPPSGMEHMPAHYPELGSPATLAEGRAQRNRRPNVPHLSYTAAAAASASASASGSGSGSASGGDPTSHSAGGDMSPLSAHTAQSMTGQDMLAAGGSSSSTTSPGDHGQPGFFRLFRQQSRGPSAMARPSVDTQASASINSRWGGVLGWFHSPPSPRRSGSIAEMRDVGSVIHEDEDIESPSLDSNGTAADEQRADNPSDRGSASPPIHNRSKPTAVPTLFAPPPTLQLPQKRRRSKDRASRAAARAGADGTSAPKDAVRISENPLRQSAGNTAATHIPGGDSAPSRPPSRLTATSPTTDSNTVVNPVHAHRAAVGATSAAVAPKLSTAGSCSGTAEPRGSDAVAGTNQRPTESPDFGLWDIYGRGTNEALPKPATAGAASQSTPSTPQEVSPASPPLGSRLFHWKR